MKTRKVKQSTQTVPASLKSELPMPGAADKVATRSDEVVRAASEAATEIAARIDVGMGNALFIRGQGDGLSWEKGTQLECKDASMWVWSSRQASDKLVFKLLLNDTVWAKGDDLVVEAGRRVEVVPGF
jgi:hypothetical protein